MHKLTLEEISVSSHKFKLSLDNINNEMLITLGSDDTVINDEVKLCYEILIELDNKILNAYAGDLDATKLNKLNELYFELGFSMYELINYCRSRSKEWQKNYLHSVNERFKQDVESLTQQFARGFMHTHEYSNQIACKTQQLENDKQFVKSRMYRIAVALGDEE